ncbi:fibronectin type III domain-containing protein 9 [Myotis yumanensis]|uniref:fibronectin type III domain-containing protein 9 n=1 Tax=Myotis yumanensis TaxID=159337 RepID=UPI0038D11E3D
MEIEVGNLSSSRAIVSWKPLEPCQEDHYNVMYRANWNNIFTGYIRNSFHYEEKVPRTVSRVALEHLAPSTFYFLCVSCKKITYPHKHHCTMFYTPDKNPLVPRGYLVNPQLSLWVLLAILLACFTAVLAFICLQYWCIRCHVPRWSYREPHLMEANGLVRWPRDGPAPDLEEEDQQGVPLVEMPRRDSGAGVEPEAEAAADAAAAADADAEDDPDAPDAGAPQREGGGQPGILPHFEG